MLKEKKLDILGKVLLFFAAMAWGSSFLVLKDAIDVNPPLYIMGIRFVFSAILLFLLFFKKIIKFNKGTIIRGSIVGVVLFFAYTFQTIGLKYTTPSRNAFLTAVYCVICPFLMWIITRQRAKLYNYISAVLCLVGVGFIALSGDTERGSNMLLGNILSLACSLFYAFQLIFYDLFNKYNDEPMQFLTTMMIVCGILLLSSSFIFELPSYTISAYKIEGNQIFYILYLTFFCTIFPQLAQKIGQKYVKSTQAGIILCFESVFAVIFSLIWGYETMSVTLGVGFTVVFASVIISETKLDFGNLFRKNKK